MHQRHTSETTTHSTSKVAKLGIDGLVGLLENLDQFRDLARFVGSDECVGSSFGTSAGSTTNAMHVVFSGLGKIVVDDVLDILDVCIRQKANEWRWRKGIQNTP
jgi:hypothetical protein